LFYVYNFFADQSINVSPRRNEQRNSRFCNFCVAHRVRAHFMRLVKPCGPLRETRSSRIRLAAAHHIGPGKPQRRAGEIAQAKTARGAAAESPAAGQ
jgi:hypothetical protein